MTLIDCCVQEINRYVCDWLLLNTAKHVEIEINLAQSITHWIVCQISYKWGCYWLRLRVRTGPASKCSVTAKWNVLVRWRLGCNSTFSCGDQFHLWVFSTHTTNYINLFQGQSNSIFVLSRAQHVRCKNLTNIKDLFISNHSQNNQNSKLATHLWVKNV